MNSMIGSEWATYGVFNYVFEKKVKLNRGKNQITLLSATVGLPVIIVGDINEKKINV